MHIRGRPITLLYRTKLLEFLSRYAMALSFDFGNVRLASLRLAILASASSYPFFLAFLLAARSDASDVQRRKRRCRVHYLVDTSTLPLKIPDNQRKLARAFQPGFPFGLGFGFSFSFVSLAHRILNEFARNCNVNRRRSCQDVQKFNNTALNWNWNIQSQRKRDFCT